MKSVDIIKKKILFLVDHPKYFFVVSTLWFGLEYILFGPFSYVRMGDNIDIFVPRLMLLGQSIVVEGITHWNRFFAGGIDQLANDVLHFNFSTLLYIFFPDWLAYVGIILTSLFIGGYYVYRICFERLKISNFSSLWAGLAFSQALVFHDIIPYLVGIGVLPFLLFLIAKIFEIEHIHKRVLFAGALGTLAAFCSSIPFTIPFISFFICLWFIFVDVSFRVSFQRKLAVLIVFFIPLFLLHIPVIISLFDQVALSNRGGDYYSTGFIYYFKQIWWLIQISIVPFLLIMMGLFLSRIVDKKFASLTILVFIFLFITQLYQPAVTVFGGYIGFIKNFGFDRFFLLIPLASVVAGSLVLDRIKGEIIFGVNKKIQAFTFFIISATMLVLILNLAVKGNRFVIWVKQGGYMVNTHHIELQNLRERTKNDPPFRFLTVTNNAIGLFPSFANIHGFETFDGDINVVSKRYSDYFRYMVNNPQQILKHTFYVSPEVESEFSDNQKTITNNTLISLANVRFVISSSPISDQESYRLIYYPDQQEGKTMGIPKVLKKVRANFKEKSVYIYENMSVLPRFFMVKDVRWFDTSDALLSALAQSDIQTVRTTAYLENTYKNSLSDELFNGTLGDITVKEYTSDRIVLHVRGDGPGLLVATNNWNKQWTAHVDGMEQPVIPVDHMFMGVALFGGEHNVVFSYIPSWVNKK